VATVQVGTIRVVAMIRIVLVKKEPVQHRHENPDAYEILSLISQREPPGQYTIVALSHVLHQDVQERLQISVPIFRISRGCGSKNIPVVQQGVEKLTATSGSSS